MGVLQACLSDVLPPVRVSSGYGSDRTVAQRAMGEEWAVVQKAIFGDSDAQEQLFGRRTSAPYRVAFALLGNKEDAEDAVQDGLCQAYTNMRSFQGRSSFTTWLTRIVIYSALMILRRRRAIPKLR